MVVQNHVEQRFMNSDSTVVLNKTELTEAIHEEADARPGRADHLRQSFLCDQGDQRLRLSWFAKFRHQQENPRQALFARVEKLINKVRLGSHTAGKQEL